MKNVLISLLVGIALLAWLYRGWNAAPRPKQTRVVVVAHYAHPCEDCPALEHTIRRLAWFFGREPVDFYAYNPANQAEALQVQQHMARYGLWAAVQRSYVKSTAVIFRVKDKKMCASFKANIDLSAAERLLWEALK